MKRMQKILLVLLSSLFIYGACPSTPSPASGAPEPELNYVSYVPSVPDALSDYSLETVSGKSAFDYFKDEKLTIGWNLGNTLDSYANRGGVNEGDERAWGNPFANQEIMNGVKAAGFNVIRIPVTWMGHFGPAPDYHIDEARLKRVAEVADMAHKAGLTAIINLHHDGSTESRQKEAGWLTMNNARKSSEDLKQITSQYARAWKQIALYFQNYGDWLIFEGFNEIHDGGWGGQTENILRSQLGIINEWNQLFTDVVRSTEGNNPQRYLMYNGYVAKGKWTLPPYFILPKDNAADKQIVAFHYYDPYEFSIAGTRSQWGQDSEKRAVDVEFSLFKSTYIDKKIPVIIGESGAARQLYPNDKAKEDKARQDRLTYVGYVYAKAKEYGLVPIYWDNGSISGNGEKFGLFNRTNGQPNMPESDAVIKVMVNAVK